MPQDAVLNSQLVGLSPALSDGIYTFVTLRDGALPPNTHPKMIFLEDEGTTFVLLRSEAEDAGLAFDFPCRIITLRVHSSPQAAGFLARITTALAKHDMALRVISGCYHHHLFVPLGREKEAMRVLTELADLAARKNFSTTTVL